MIGSDGKNARNPNRDALNKRIKERGYEVFDPQIDEVSHGRRYDYTIDGPAEQAARKGAYVTLYELADGTQAAVTQLEILNDVIAGKRVILWLSGEPNGKGKPQYKPAGFNADNISDPATKAHALQGVKQGNDMRANLIDFTKGKSNLRTVRTFDEVIAAFRQFGIKL